MRILNEKWSGAKVLWLVLAFVAVAGLAHAKEVLNPVELGEGAEVQVRPDLSQPAPMQVQFATDPYVTDGIYLPGELKVGEQVVFTNNSYFKNAKTAILLVEKLPQGGLSVRLENHAGFNYKIGDVPGGFTMLYSGQLIFPKFGDEEGVVFASPESRAYLKTDAEAEPQEIKAQVVHRLLLPSGASLTVTAGALPVHTALSQGSKLLYHLAEQDKLFQRVGKVSFSALLDIDKDGDGYFERKLFPGDVVRIHGPNPESFAFLATKNQQGSELRIKSWSQGHALHSVQINDEAPIAIGPMDPVVIASEGGNAGYLTHATAKAGEMMAGETAFTAAGGVLQIDFFTTLPEGLDLNAPKGEEDPKPGYPGPQDWTQPSPAPEETSLPEPHFVPNPTPEPLPSAEPQSGNDSGKNWIDPDYRGAGGWASCSLHSAPAIPGGWVPWLLSLPWLGWALRRK